MGLEGQTFMKNYKIKVELKWRQTVVFASDACTTTVPTSLAIITHNFQPKKQFENKVSTKHISAPKWEGKHMNEQPIKKYKLQLR